MDQRREEGQRRLSEMFEGWNEGGPTTRRQRGGRMPPRDRKGLC